MEFFGGLSGDVAESGTWGRHTTNNDLPWSKFSVKQTVPDRIRPAISFLVLVLSNSQDKNRAAQLAHRLAQCEAILSCAAQ
jgi:hypothetical protein